MSKQDQSKSVSRRDFMRNAAKITAGTAIGAAAIQKTAQAHPNAVKMIFPQSVYGANEKIRTGHIGIGGMGRANLGFVLQRDDMQPIALCDLWYKNRDRAKQMAGQKFPEDGLAMIHDFREVIDNKDVDAVVIATPDHWHTLITMYAADAGKAIYCEKPLSTTVEEAAAAAKKVHDKGVVFQGGTMQRSGPLFQEAVQMVKDGYIGKVAHVETYIHDDESLEGIGMGDDDISNYEGADWIFHQGWVEHKPFNTNRWIYNFRWFLDYSGGKITDWGVHLVDIALWAMGEDKQPLSVTCQGNKFLMQDNRTTPDTLAALWEYDNYILSFTNRVYNSFLPEGWQSHGILFHGTLGTMRVDRGGYEVYSVGNNGGCEPVKKQADQQMNQRHWENFCNSVRGTDKPIVPIDVIHNTTRTCHLGTCAYVAGGKLKWNADEEKFFGSDEETVAKANGWAYREYQNGWSLKEPYDVGANVGITKKA
jgi:predicted dehydrogenase